MASADNLSPSFSLKSDHNTTSAPMDVDSSTPLTARLSSYLTTIEKASGKQTDAVLKNLQKMIAALKKTPVLLASRKFRLDNIAIKKFIVDVPGAMDLMKAVGFQQVELTDKKIPWIVMEDQQLASPQTKADIDTTLDAIATKLTDLEKAATAAPPKPTAAPGAPVMCLGGCGFCGSPDTGGYCSVCFKKAMAGVGSPNKAPAPTTHSDPFVTPPKAGSAAAAAAVATPPAASSSSSAAASSAPAAAPAAPAAPKCLKNCGRAGSSEFKGFCETCYKRIISSGQPPKRWRCLFDGAIVKLRAVHRFNLGKKPVQEKKNRCWVCQKKVGILGFECRCRYVFCSQHRYMEQHDCRYDIKSLHRLKLQKENAEIRAAKLEKL